MRGPQNVLHPITIRVRGPILRNKRNMLDSVIETHPAVGEKFMRARCRNTALPRPAEGAEAPIARAPAEGAS